MFLRGAATASKADEYRAKARECERLAAAAPDGTIKVFYLDLARQWRELAALREY